LFYSRGLETGGDKREAIVGRAGHEHGQLVLDLGSEAAVQGSLSGRSSEVRRPPSQRAFFAIMPEPEDVGPLRPIIDGICESAGARSGRVSPSRWHISLLCLDAGEEITDDVLGFGRQIAEQVRMPAFELCFDRVASWGRGELNRPFVLYGDDGLAGVTLLHDRIRDILLPGDEKPRPWFEPHMTLAYGRARIAERAIKPVSWRARSLVLVQSFVGAGRYLIRGRWPLAS
jgi:2'-5' RNA ligase